MDNQRKSEIMTKLDGILEKHAASLRSSTQTWVDKLIRDYDRQIEKLNKRIEKLENASTTSIIQRPSSAVGGTRVNTTRGISDKGGRSKMTEPDRPTRAKARKVPDSDSE